MPLKCLVVKKATKPMFYCLWHNLNINLRMSFVFNSIPNVFIQQTIFILWWVPNREKKNTKTPITQCNNSMRQSFCAICNSVPIELNTQCSIIQFNCYIAWFFLITFLWCGMVVVSSESIYWLEAHSTKQMVIVKNNNDDQFILCVPFCFWIKID